MKNNNLALEDDLTSSYQELDKTKNLNFSKPYFGTSKICKLVHKTEEGKIIDDCLNEQSNNTADSGEVFSTADIIPRQKVALYQKPTKHSLVLNKWQGYIETIDGNEFTAVLTDVLGKTPDIRADFSIDDVSEGDRKLVCENAPFEWVISRERKSHGQIENKDYLIFRRFPMWKKRDLDVQSTKVNEFSEWLNSNTSS